MLYIFQVDTGDMLTFDMNLAMESVKRLQEVISKTCKIAEDKQVLLISGGQNLSPTSRVCSYSAGTDTNPIFLFSKNTIESASPPSGSVNYGAEVDLNEKVEGSMSMQPSYDTIVTRTQLSLQFHDIDKEEMKLCEGLVHDQHLQHQGWAAVIANLEDITSAFQQKWQNMSQKIEQHLVKRQHHITILTRFPDTVQLLSKIPLLGCLSPSFTLSMSESRTSMISSKSSLPTLDLVSQSPPCPPVTMDTAGRPGTLLEWISAQESKSTLDQMTHQCLEGLNQFDEKVRDGLKEEVQSLLTAVNNPSMKEVKGLEDRLYGLEQLMYGAKKLVQEQGHMSQGFVQNQNRARNLHDPSVLPDLCNSHKRQLVAMLKNHQSLHDIRRRCMRAKDELSENLHTRLRWVMYIEKSICDLHGKLVIYLQRLKKLQHCLRLILQMHSAPDMYCSAVIEVVRRKRFAYSFLEWSSGLCQESKELHEQEMEKRHFFSSSFKNHFLQTLFPGFSDRPPGFATKCPDRFDENLPPIKRDDIQYLKEKVPELAEKLKFPDDSSSPLVFPQISFFDTQGTSSRDSSSQAPQSLEQAPDQTAKRERKATDECDADDTVVINTAAEVQASMDEVNSLRLAPLDASGITVSQSVEVVTETEVSTLQEEQLSVLKVGPHVGLSPTTEVPHPPQSSRPRTGSATKEHGKRDSKLTPSTSSPDTDEVASEGFTTADFYIDESMPSSLTESAGRKLAEMQQVIQEKTSQLESKDRQMEEQQRSLDQVQCRLDKAQENFHLLHDVVQKGALQLKCDVLSMEKQVQKEKDEHQNFMDTVTNKLVQMIANFEEKETSKRDTQIEDLKQDHLSTVGGLEDRLEVECEKLRDAQSEIDVYDRKLKEKMDELESLKLNMDKCVSELKQSHDSYEEELKSTVNQMVLEQEVELEKVKSDLDLDLVKKDQEIQELSGALDLKDRTLCSLQGDMAKQEQALNEKFQKEKEEIRKILLLEFEQKEKDMKIAAKDEVKCDYEEEKRKLMEQCELDKTSACETLQKELDNDKERALSDLREELQKAHEFSLETLKSSVLEQQKKAVDDLRPEIEGEFGQRITELRSAFDAERQELVGKISENERTSKEQQEEMERLKWDQAVVMETRETSPMLQLSEEDFVTISAHREELQKVIEEQQSRHESELTELTHKLQKDKADSMQEMKTSTTAEKQIIFNEALNKLVEDHKKEIEEIKGKDEEEMEQLQRECGQLREQLEKTAGTSGSSFCEKGAQFPSLGSQQSSSQKDLEPELSVARQRILELESGLAVGGALAGPSPPSVMGQSVMPVTDTLDPRIQTLENTLRTKSEEVNRLQSKIMELSMSTSFGGLVQDKVSITTCNIGDLVLLCLDDQRANYVVFTVTNLLHFLHSDYLDALGLKTGPGESKKSWVLAEVIDKEYCQAKKPQNRYNVPVGTKFYRIKARPWNRDTALQHQQQLRHQHQQLQISGIHPALVQQQQQQQHWPTQQQTSAQQQGQPAQQESTQQQTTQQLSSSPSACDPLLSSSATPPSEDEHS